MYLSSDRLFTLDEQDNYFKKYLELGVKVQGHTTGFPCIKLCVAPEFTELL